MPDTGDPQRKSGKDNLDHIDLVQIFQDIKERQRAEVKNHVQLDTHGGFLTRANGNTFLITDNRDYSFIANLGMQAADLDKVLPRDLNTLTSIVNDPTTPIEWRSKMLEVIVFRGAINEFSYRGMTREGIAGSDLSTPAKFDLIKERGDEFKERLAYQEAARDAVFRDPAVFGELTKSPDQLPQGRTAATEFMHTMLRDGGLYGSDEARQHFESELKKFPPEVRGQAMYHLLDAGQTSDIHLKGERRTTGWGVDVSIDTGHGGLGVGYSTQWDHVANNHWQEVGRDITREMRHDIDQRPQAYRDAHEKGFKEAAGRDRGFSEQ
jgi:hypothetical protein